MRKLSLGVMLSATVHGVAMAWIGARAFTARVATPVAAPPIEIEVIEPPSPPPPAVPIDVALASAPVQPAQPATPAPHNRPPPPPAVRPLGAPPSPAQAPRASGADHPEIALAVPGPGPGAAREPTSPQPPGQSPTAPKPPTTMMAMRRGELPRPALSVGRWDDLTHVPRGTTPEKDLATGILHESGGGRYESDQGVFVGKVAPDGSVKLTDRQNLHVHVALPSPRDLGSALAGWYESDKGAYGAEGDTGMARQIQVSPGASTEPHDPVDPRPKDRATTAVVPVLSGGFDVSDWLMRSHGQDPYAAKKLAFLDATRDERVQIGNRHRAQQLALTPQIVQKNLDALWAAAQDVQARKQALFELWDECTEAGDPAAVEAGEAARRLVIGFIRAHLPAGSPGAYTLAELAALARKRHAKAAFQPYE